MRQDWVDGFLIIILIPTQYNVFNANVFVMVYLAVLFLIFRYKYDCTKCASIYTCLPCRNHWHWRYKKKNIYPSKPVYDLKKIYLYFFHILNSTALWSSPLRP